MYKYIFFLFLFYTLSSSSQNYIYQHFGVDEGLPSSEVFDMYQDKQGYIWFATGKGLSRYNGYEFENFDVNKGLTGNMVLKFYPQTNGQIWCYAMHSQSLFYFDEVFKGFTAYKYNHVLKKRLDKESIIKSVYLSKDNNLHVGGYKIDGELIVDDSGVVSTSKSSKKYNLKKIKMVLKETLENHESPFLFTTNDPDTPFFVQYSGTHLMGCWLVDNQKAILFDGKSIQIKELGKKEIFVANEFPLIRVKRIDDAHFFVGYKFGGGSIINAQGNVVTTFLKNKSVSDFLIDHNNGYWLTTLNSGAYYIKSPIIKSFRSLKEIKSTSINSLAKANNELFIGYEDGTIGKITSDQTFKLLKASRKVSPAFVEYDNDYDVLLFYNNNILKNVASNKELLNNHIVKLSEPRNEVVYASLGKGFYKLTYKGGSEKFFSPHRVLDVCFWNGITYVGTPKGVFKYENDTLISISNESKSLGYRAEDIDVSYNRDKLFIASQGAGVIVYAKDLYTITTEDGLYSNQINEIYVESDETIWVCTNKGLNKITFEGDQFIVSGIDKKYGLLSNEIKDVEIIGNTVWVGTNDGICYFPKSLLEEKSDRISFLEILEIKSNNKVLDASDVLELEYRNNTIDFRLQEISYPNNQDIIYQYRLIGLNNDWKSTTDRNVSFSPLFYGEYIFEAKSCVNGSCSDKTVQQHFIIYPPFWNTWWFYLLCFLALASIIYTFFKIRVLTYNKDLTREFIRLLLKRLKRKENFLSLRELGNDIKIKSNDILYVKSANNYINIITDQKTYTVRLAIGKFLDEIPDKLEYVRIHRSYIIRLDKVTAKSKNEVFIQDVKIPVGQRYLQNLKNIHF